MDETNAKSAVSRGLLEHTLPAWDELPDFELYMDQVLSLTGRYLEGMPNSEDSKLTASMINNYVKVKIIPAPQGKRYSRRHVAYLLLLCILKPVLPIAAIQKLFAARTTRPSMSASAGYTGRPAARPPRISASPSRSCATR